MDDNQFVACDAIIEHFPVNTMPMGKNKFSTETDDALRVTHFWQLRPDLDKNFTSRIRENRLCQPQGYRRQFLCHLEHN